MTAPPRAPASAQLPALKMGPFRTCAALPSPVTSPPSQLPQPHHYSSMSTGKSGGKDGSKPKKTGRSGASRLPRSVPRRSLTSAPVPVHRKFVLTPALPRISLCNTDAAWDPLGAGLTFPGALARRWRVGEAADATCPWSRSRSNRALHEEGKVRPATRRGRPE